MLTIYFMGFTLAVAIVTTKSSRRLSALEVRLQNVEHLLSLSASESRSSAVNGLAHGVPTSTNETRERVDAPLQRRAKRKPSHYAPAHDRRTEGQ